MTLAEQLTSYHALSPRTIGGQQVMHKAGVREAGGLQLARYAELKGKRLLDLSGSLGVLTLQSGAAQSLILESSRAALRCLQATFKDRPDVTVAAGASWEAPQASFEVAFISPSSDKGNRRVALELYGVAQALLPAGSAYVLLHKDQGAKRYEAQLAELFHEVTVVAKGGGWRLSRACRPRPLAPPERWVRFEAAGLSLCAEVGVYAAGKCDPGTAFLLSQLELASCAGKRVLELGCGYGLVALKAALAQGVVSALDDDLLAVRAAHRNAAAYGADLRVLHSDVDSELSAQERFEVVLMNPPFHRGKQVALAVPSAFIAAAYTRLTPGGTLVLVANRALPYERLLAHFAYWETLAVNQSFKVLQAYK